MPKDGGGLLNTKKPAPGAEQDGCDSGAPAQTAQNGPHQLTDQGRGPRRQGNASHVLELTKTFLFTNDILF